jgi:hypothetical protein
VAVASQPASAPASQPVVRYRLCPPGIRLTTIIQQSGGNLAHINGRLVHVGQMVRGAQVMAIHDTTVEMELDGERFIVGFGTNAPPPPEDEDLDAVPAPADQPAAEEGEPATTTATKPAAAAAGPKAMPPANSGKKPPRKAAAPQ